MEGKIRRVHPPALKSKVALAMIKGDQTAAEICSQFTIHPTQAQKWKQKALKTLENGFGESSLLQQLKMKDDLIERLYRQVGKLQVELDWLKKKLGLTT